MALKILQKDLNFKFTLLVIYVSNDGLESQNLWDEIKSITGVTNIPFVNSWRLQNALRSEERIRSDPIILAHC